jgi:hypothetical protein
MGNICHGDLLKPRPDQTFRDQPLAYHKLETHDRVKKNRNTRLVAASGYWSIDITIEKKVKKSSLINPTGSNQHGHRL